MFSWFRKKTEENVLHIDEINELNVSEPVESIIPQSLPDTCPISQELSDTDFSHEPVPSLQQNLSPESNEAKDLIKGVAEQEPFLTDYIYPTVDLLNETETDINNNFEELEKNKEVIVSTLSSYKVNIKSISVTAGPTLHLVRSRSCYWC